MYDNYCSFCGRNCACSSISRFSGYRSSEALKAERERKMEEELRRWAALQYSLKMSRDFSPRPGSRPTVHGGILSMAFHWIGHRKRAFKMRASRPGWDRGR